MSNMPSRKLLIKNAKIVDGSGTDAFSGDILIVGDTIEKIGVLSDIADNADIIELDAKGRAATPGFIDIHRHCDYALFKPGFGEIELAQGITTAITGSCGLTPFPLNPAYEDGLQDILAPCLGDKPPNIDYTDYASYYTALGNTSLPINIGGQIGSCSVRIATKGFDSSPFTDAEAKSAISYVSDALYIGAFGLSLGLMYTPEFYSTRDELVRIARIAASCGAVLTCHIRGEGDSLCKSIDEVIDIAERTNIRLEISHFKSCGLHNWHKSIHDAISSIDKAKSRGLNIGVDFYPYTGGATTLLSLIPPYYMKESLEATLNFMSTSTGANALRDSLKLDHPNWDNYVKILGWDKLLLASAKTEENQIYIGKSIAEITALHGYKDECACLLDILIAERGRAGVIVMSMAPADIDSIARLPYSTIISDSLYVSGSGSHPRLYGAFSRIIRDFVTDRKILSLENAVHKMTQKPAEVMGIKKRGLIKQGFKADICIFDPKNIIDNATYKDPRQLSSGMDYVLLNGQIAWRDGKMADANTGQRLKRV